MARICTGHLAVLAVAGTLGACAQPKPAGPAPASAVEGARQGALALLAHGAAAWNRGDLAGFMSDYAPDASFVTPRQVLHGRAEIQARYAPRFAPGGVRDSLSFQDLEVDPLAPDALNAIAFYVLQRGDSIVARGPTSLVMRKLGGRWYIAHDHSS
jgi:uncharacterized protein (TIGR02246 family)